MKSGIAISTYFCSKTHRNRNGIFKQCIDSLVSSMYPGEKFLIDDGSENKSHLTYAKDKGIIVIERKENGGEGRVKNTSLRVLLDSGCDYLFVSDDDMLFAPGWWDVYINAMDVMSIPHMAYVIDQIKTVKENFNGIEIVRVLAPTTNGCFLTMTKAVPETIGGWPIGPVKFGHLHENYSMRCLKYGLIPFYCDLWNKKTYVTLNPESHNFCFDRYCEDIDKNLYLLVNPPMWEDIRE
jgi:GT2 family glycosyltransferase